MKSWKPKIINNSRIPALISKIAPISIWAISFGPFVWCRGHANEITVRHETVHFQQQLELLFVFQWLLYGIFWLVGLVKYRSAEAAYYQNPFEQEAYANQRKVGYLTVRERYAWRRYKI